MSLNTAVIVICAEPFRGTKLVHLRAANVLTRRDPLRVLTGNALFLVLAIGMSGLRETRSFAKHECPICHEVFPLARIGAHADLCARKTERRKNLKSKQSTAQSSRSARQVRAFSHRQPARPRRLAQSPPTPDYRAAAAANVYPPPPLSPLKLLTHAPYLSSTVLHDCSAL